MNKTEVQLVKPETLSINLTAVSSPMTVGADGDEVIVLVRLALRPRNNVMDIDINVATGGDGAPVPSFDKYSPPYFCGDWWPIFELGSHVEI